MLHGFYRKFEDLKPQEVEIDLKPSTMASLIATVPPWHVKNPMNLIDSWGFQRTKETLWL